MPDTEQSLGKHRSYKAVCFDLDGTLLPMDIDEFMRGYYARLEKFAEDSGLDAKRFMAALNAGVGKMMANDGAELNKDAFWREFETSYGEGAEGVGTDSQAAIRVISDDFYENEFGHIGDGFEADPRAAHVVQMLKDKGYPLVLATMPMFPLRAVEHRLDWAGVDPAKFDRITNYGNSKSVKPRHAYFAEVLSSLGPDVRGEDVLMVGNNTMEDLTFLDLGVDAYLVTDWLLDPVDFDLDSVRHGTMADFEEWVASLPECVDPAMNISAGEIDPDDATRALEENAVVHIDADATEAKAKAVSDAINGSHEDGASLKMKVEL